MISQSRGGITGTWGSASPSVTALSLVVMWSAGVALTAAVATPCHLPVALSGLLWLELVASCIPDELGVRMYKSHLNCLDF